MSLRSPRSAETRMRALYYHYLISGVNSSTVFYATGIADSGINPCFNFRSLSSLLATHNSGIDSGYGLISLVRRKHAWKTRTLTSLEPCLSRRLWGPQCRWRAVCYLSTHNFLSRRCKVVAQPRRGCLSQRGPETRCFRLEQSVVCL